MFDESKKPDSLKKEATLKVLKEIRAMASDMMKNGLKDGMAKKVMVAAKDSEGLKEGLDKAKEIVSQMPEDESSDHEEAEEIEESSSEESDSIESIEAKIKELEAKKQQLMK